MLINDDLSSAPLVVAPPPTPPAPPFDMTSDKVAFVVKLFDLEYLESNEWALACKLPHGSHNGKFVIKCINNGKLSSTNVKNHIEKHHSSKIPADFWMSTVSAGDSDETKGAIKLAVRLCVVAVSGN